MSAKKTNKKTKDVDVSKEYMPDMPKDVFVQKICDIRCEIFGESILKIENRIEGYADELQKEMDLMKKDMKEYIDHKSDNMKDKIVIVEKSIGEKIDYLNDFDRSLKGNGSPGVWESIREIKKTQKIIIWILTTLAILQLGGSFRGVSWESIGDALNIFSKSDSACIECEETPTEVKK